MVQLRNYIGGKHKAPYDAHRCIDNVRRSNVAMIHWIIYRTSYGKIPSVTLKQRFKKVKIFVLRNILWLDALLLVLSATGILRFRRV